VSTLLPLAADNSSILSCFAFVDGSGEGREEACGFGCGVCWLDSYVIGCQVLEIWAAGGNDLRWGFYAAWTETALGRVFFTYRRPSNSCRRLRGGLTVEEGCSKVDDL